MKYEHITVFLTNGHTLRFHKVTNYGGAFHGARLGDGAYADFEYESAFDGKHNVARLYFNQIVMVSGVEAE